MELGEKASIGFQHLCFPSLLTDPKASATNASAAAILARASPHEVVTA